MKISPEKRGGIAFKDERGMSERHHYFRDRENLLKGKDLRNFGAITEKSYFFKDVPFKE